MATPPLSVIDGKVWAKMQSSTYTKGVSDRKVWFSMWFLGAVVTFGVAFFPMFYRLVEGRNLHVQKQVELERQVAAYMQSNGKAPPPPNPPIKKRNAKLWAASIILIIPAFVLIYLLSKDLAAHEQREDMFLSAALPERVFMTQTIPLTSYVLITIVTLGVGGVYWLYKLVNLYNAHYKADRVVEKELVNLLEKS